MTRETQENIENITEQNKSGALKTAESNITQVDLKTEPLELHCSQCHKKISPGTFITRMVRSKKVLCPDCDEGVLEKGDMFLAIE
jgi:NAD-dependent SIR2 family protein deacetylase